jgi:enoyl-CoA hydratase/carnithine racemase
MNRTCDDSTLQLGQSIHVGSGSPIDKLVTPISTMMSPRILKMLQRVQIGRGSSGRRCLSNLAAIKKAIKLSGAPESIALIGDEGSDADRTYSAFIRQVGCTRRVFLLNPHLTSAELEGLAYRVRVLSKNEGINSVLIATDGNDEGTIPSLVIDRDYPYLRDGSIGSGYPPAPGETYHVASGYDPLFVFKDGKHKARDFVSRLMSNLTDLAMAVLGDAKTTKVPTISLQHGLVSDGGFAFFLASYVMATNETCFRILNPSRGLSLDPVGLSFVLPRLGQEFQQLSANYQGCGMILGLMGYEADHEDLLETGLATNYMETPAALGLLEQTLAELRPWNQQGLLKEPIRLHGEDPPVHDHNASLRNIQVADTISCFSSGRADRRDVWGFDENDDYDDLMDPSIDLDHTPWHQPRCSDLVSYAATFDDIFKKEPELFGILERFREIAARTTDDPEVQEGIDVAADFVKSLERQSPLALSVVHRLLQLGSRKDETLKSCITREHRAQVNLFGRSDFETWAKHATRGVRNEKPFPGWLHKSIAAVHPDEVEEILVAELVQK